MGREIERLQQGIVDVCLGCDIALPPKDAEVLAVHDNEATPSTGEDVVAPASEAISLVGLTHRLAETEIGKELLKDVHLFISL